MFKHFEQSEAKPLADFSHLKESGESRMVDISEKIPSKRIAAASGRLIVSEVCDAKLNENSIVEISRCARIAGIMAAKKTSDLIPMCHQLNLNSIDLNIEYVGLSRAFQITATAITQGKTGCLLYTSPSPRDATLSRMPSSA